jgi:hypothetical protein
MQTNVIKLQFLKNGEAQGREYTYYAPEGAELAPGDTVAIEITKGVITQTDVPVEEIAPFADKAKTIIGRINSAEQDDENVDIIESYEEHTNCAIGMLTLAMAKYDWAIVKQAHGELIAAGVLPTMPETDYDDAPFTGQ